jgi:uncharacterized protein YbjQ (UPF0145 family)
VDLILRNFDLFILLVLLCIGYVFGRIAESRHYRSIIEREKQLADILLFAAKRPPPETTDVDTALVSGSAVISSDYFKWFVAGLRKLFGGRFRVYETLLDRARREAILRLKQQTRELGGNAIFNIKFESFNVTMGARGGIAAIEILAYGTALVPKRPG